MGRRSAFENYLRTGRQADRLETKFNPWHDPENGRFTFAGQGTNVGGGSVNKPLNWRPGGRMATQDVKRRAANAMRMYRIHIARGMTPEQAAGWAANAEAESRSDYRARQEDGGPGRGLFQWGSDAAKFDRRLNFQRLFGHSIEQSTEEEQLAFRDWELGHTYKRAARKISEAKSVGNIAAAIVIHYEQPAKPERDAADRANIAEAIMHLAKR